MPNSRRPLVAFFASLAFLATACASDPDAGDGDDADAAVATDAPEPLDAAVVRCGDTVCSPTESVMTCPADCPPVCGDHACTHQESAVTCAGDCPAVCGDHACTGSESVTTCLADCPAVCGDTLCSPGETAGSCAADCAATCGDGACTHGETAATCASDCPSVCADNICSANETCGTCAQDCGACLPAAIDITLIGALISPSTSDGRTWDGPDLTTTQINDLATLASLLSGQSPYVDIAAFVVNLGIMAYAPPDPFGVAELAWNGPFDPARNLELANTSTNTEDTFNPQWPGPPFPGWINVPSGPTLRVRVTLQDEDLVFDDMIGTAELSAEDLRAAFNSGGIANIAVYDQGVHQILYLSVSVTASAPPQVCNGECTANLYSACTCAAGDPCGWLGDGVCDSFCTANFPSNHLDDFTDCAAACASDCQNLLYSACTCASVDPCNWQNDGVCDDTCAQSFPADHFDDPLDCP